MTPGNLLHVPDVNGLSGAHAACSRKVSLPSEPGPPMTLGNAAARVRLIVWCKECQHQVGVSLNVTMSPAFLDARTLVLTHMVRVIEDR
jgi:hypothetical protein